jgi:glycerol-3-phosphate dehydrogenase
MWKKGWREQIWPQLDQVWDLIIIGGGITGAGILREAANAGLKVLLLEANDFSSGTSSRSSKLIHGGLRYMRNLQFGVTFEAVRERQWMLKTAPKLVTPLEFVIPNYKDSPIPDWQLVIGMLIYDAMATQWKHKQYSKAEIKQLFPELKKEGLSIGFRYLDSEVDDSRLALRVILEAVKAGGVALNYARVDNLLRDTHGQVNGVVVRDTSAPDGAVQAVEAGVVINATGPWTDEIRKLIGAPERMRRTRGSHLIFEHARFPIKHGFTLVHPDDHRMMFALPWEGVSIIGTTDVDEDPAHREQEPFASQEEIEYILRALNDTFPQFELQRSDILSTYAGIRPIVSSGSLINPSKESRKHAIWEENGLLTITGGKMTTFHAMACDVLNKASQKLPGRPSFPTQKPVFNALPADLPEVPLDQCTMTYLIGRYGTGTAEMLSAAQGEDLEHIEQFPGIWAEVRWSARNEGVIHLDDLLLRRTRLGLLLPNGAQEYLPRIRKIAQPELGWDEARWEGEVSRYVDIWKHFYSPNPSQ